jgi:thiopurine S-methyltransferase
MTEDRFWQDRWDNGQIGFHESKPNALLLRHNEELLGNGIRRRVFVPLSGKSLDMKWIAERGHDVVGCELVEKAARAFFEEAGVVAESSEREPYRALSANIGAGSVTILIGNALQIESRHTGAIDAVFDRAALIALPWPLRRQYVGRVLDLLSSGARILLISFEHDAEKGPPFSVDDAEVHSLYETRCALSLLERNDVLTESAHIVAKGGTRVHEAAYLAIVH